MLLSQSQNTMIDSYKLVTKGHLYMATDQTYESMESAIFFTKWQKRNFRLQNQLSPTNARASPISNVIVQNKIDHSSIWSLPHFPHHPKSNINACFHKQCSSVEYETSEKSVMFECKLYSFKIWVRNWHGAWSPLIADN